MSESNERGHETRDASARGVFWFSAGLVFTLALIFAITGGLYRFLEHQHPSPEAPSRIALHPRVLAPAPQLQTDPTIDLEKYEAAQRAKLNGYGWVDRDAGVIRLPIARAMELIAERGLPTRGPGTQNASGLTAVDMQNRKAEATK